MGNNITSSDPGSGPDPPQNPDDAHQKQLFADFYDDLESQFGLDLVSAFTSASFDLADRDQFPDPDQRSSLCVAAIRLEPRFANLRYRLVPGRIGEHQFWTEFLIRYDEFSTRFSADLSPELDQHPMAPIPARSGTEQQKETVSISAATAPATADLPKIEVTLLTITEVFVYQIRPRRDAQGHYAQTWGLDNPLWSGALRVISSEDFVVFLRLYDPASGDVFANSDLINLEEICRQSEPTRSARLKAIRLYIEPTLDTSRYFVVRLKNPISGQIAFLGVGFRHRSSAFDLSASILDQLAKCERFMNLEDKVETRSPTNSSVSTRENVGNHAECVSKSIQSDESLSNRYQLPCLPSFDQDGAIPPALSPPRPQYLYREPDDEDEDAFGLFLSANQPTARPNHWQFTTN